MMFQLLQGECAIIQSGFPNIIRLVQEWKMKPPFNKQTNHITTSLACCSLFEKTWVYLTKPYIINLIILLLSKFLTDRAQQNILEQVQNLLVIKSLQLILLGATISVLLWWIYEIVFIII